MNLRSLSDQELLASTKRAVDREREAITEVLRHFREIDERKLFGVCSSLYQFAMKEYGYSEAETNARVTACRLLRQVPEIEVKIESGALTLTHLVKASAFFAQEKKSEKPLARVEKLAVLEKLENKSVRDGERMLFALSSNPMPLKERTRVASQTHTEITFYANEEQMALFTRLKEIWGHALPQASWIEILTRAAEIAIEKEDPLKKAERAIVRKEKKLSRAAPISLTAGTENQPAQPAELLPQPNVPGAQTHETCRSASMPTSACGHDLGLHAGVPASWVSANVTSEVNSSVGIEVMVNVETREHRNWAVAKLPRFKCRPGYRPAQRPAVPASVKHEVRIRDEDRCTYVGPDGQRCQSRHGLECDHQHPYASGGFDSVDNLRLRCRAHNLRAAIEIFGSEKISQFWQKPRTLSYPFTTIISTAGGSRLSAQSQELITGVDF